jgi:hypothetical protein
MACGYIGLYNNNSWWSNNSNNNTGPCNMMTPMGQKETNRWAMQGKGNESNNGSGVVLPSSSSSPTMTLERVIHKCKTGDMILFQDYTFMARVILASSGFIDWSHVAMVVRFMPKEPLIQLDLERRQIQKGMLGLPPELGDLVYIWEALCYDHYMVDALLGRLDKGGTRLVSMEDWLLTHFMHSGGKVVYCEVLLLDLVRNEVGLLMSKYQNRLRRFMQKVKDYGYESNKLVLINLLLKVIPDDSVLMRKEGDKAREYFCSQLLIDTYNSICVVKKDRISACYTLLNFTERKQQVKFSPSCIEVGGEVDVVFTLLSEKTMKK